VNDEELGVPQGLRDNNKETRQKGLFLLPFSGQAIDSLDIRGLSDMCWAAAAALTSPLWGGTSDGAKTRSFPPKQTRHGALSTPIDRWKQSTVRLLPTLSTPGHFFLSLLRRCADPFVRHRNPAPGSCGFVRQQRQPPIHNTRTNLFSLYLFVRSNLSLSLLIQNAVMNAKYKEIQLTCLNIPT
jgi:hypothetical protein